MKKPTPEERAEAIEELGFAGVDLNEAVNKIERASELTGIRCKCLIDAIEKAAGVLYGKLHRLEESK